MVTEPCLSCRRSRCVEEGVAAEDSGRTTPKTPESGSPRAGEAHPSPVSDGSSNRAVMASDMLGQKLKTWKSGILTSVGALDKQSNKVWSRPIRDIPRHP